MSMARASGNLHEKTPDDLILEMEEAKAQKDAEDAQSAAKQRARLEERKAARAK